MPAPASAPPSPRARRARARGPAALTLALAALSLATPADANGRFKRAQYLVAGPGARDDVIALRTTFGILASEDGGARFHFLCEDAFAYGDGEDPSVSINARGDMLVGTFTGLMVTRDWCAPRPQADLAGYNVVDLTQDPAGRTVFAAIVSRDVVPVSRVARSTDAGDTFDVPPDGVVGARMLTVDVAPNAPLRLYASAQAHDTGAPMLLRSDDGGRTWRPAGADLSRYDLAFVSAVDPRSADGLWVRATLRADLFDASTQPGTVLLRSDDGGATAREVGRTVGEMTGFASTDDGRTVWFGGDDESDGLFRIDDGAAPVREAAARVECLRWHAGTLWVCERFTPGGVMLRRRGATGALTPALRFDEIDAPPSRCAPGTATRDICPLRWAVVAPTLRPAAELDASTARDVAGPRDDRAVAPAPRCDCDVMPARSKSAVNFLEWLCAVAMAVRGRRRELQGLRGARCEARGRGARRASQAAAAH